MQAVLDLLADYGLDPTRGGMTRALAEHVGVRCRALGVDEAELVARLRGDVDGERQRLIHVATVRHSWFYRDAGQLDALAGRLRARHLRTPERALELWIAGCAAGEEAWTMAMLAADLGLSVRLLATDVDALALHEARAAQYGAWSLRDLPERLWRFLEPAGEGRWCVADRLRDRVEFEVHNLCDPAPPGRFDVICCRNVLIYFEPARAHAVVERLRYSLQPEGELLLGASDLLFRVDEQARLPTASFNAARVPPVDRSRPVATKLRGEPASSRPPPAPAPAPRAVVEPERGDSTRPIMPIIEADQTRASLGRAGEAVELGDFARALEQLAPLVERDPLLVEAHLWAGIAHYGLGQDQLAAEALRRARCLAPQLWPATLFAALTNERRGRWVTATRCWTELERIMQSPDAPAIEGTAVLLDALPRWRSEALALARQRKSKHAVS